MDFAQLVFQVKNKQALQGIDQVDKKLKETQSTAAKLFNTLITGWSLTKLSQSILALTNKYRDLIIVQNNFTNVFKKFNQTANTGVNVLINRFHQTERSAKRLMSLIGSRVDFDFGTDQLGKVSSELARVTEQISMFYGMDLDAVSLKLTNAMAGQTRGLKDLGIVISTTSPKFKQLVEDLKNSKGYSQEAAKAYATYLEILQKTQKYQGTFDLQARTLEQAVGDIKNTLISGPLAKTGQILNKIFTPILQRINQILSIPMVSDILGIQLAIAAIIGTIALLEKAINSLSDNTVKTSTEVAGNIMAETAKVGNYINTVLNKIPGEAAEVAQEVSAQAAKAQLALLQSYQKLGAEYNKIMNASFAGGLGNPAKIQNIYKRIQISIAKADGYLTETGAITDKLTQQIQIANAKIKNAATKTQTTINQLRTKTQVAATKAAAQIKSASSKIMSGFTSFIKGVGKVTFYALIAQSVITMGISAGRAIKQYANSEGAKTFAQQVAFVFDGIFEKIWNWIKGKGFQTDQQISNKLIEEGNQLFADAQKLLKQTQIQIEQYKKQLNKKNISQTQLLNIQKKSLTKMKNRLSTLQEQYQKQAKFLRKDESGKNYYQLNIEYFKKNLQQLQNAYKSKTNATIDGKLVKDLTSDEYNQKIEYFNSQIKKYENQIKNAAQQQKKRVEQIAHLKKAIVDKEKEINDLNDKIFENIKKSYIESQKKILDQINFFEKIRTIKDKIAALGNLNTNKAQIANLEKYLKFIKDSIYNVSSASIMKNPKLNENLKQMYNKQLNAEFQLAEKRVGILEQQNKLFEQSNNFLIRLFNNVSDYINRGVQAVEVYSAAGQQIRSSYASDTSMLSKWFQQNNTNSTQNQNQIKKIQSDTLDVAKKIYQQLAKIDGRSIVELKAVF